MTSLLKKDTHYGTNARLDIRLGGRCQVTHCVHSQQHVRPSKQPHVTTSPPPPHQLVLLPLASLLPVLWPSLLLLLPK